MPKTKPPTNNGKPKRPVTVSAREFKALRKATGLTQAQFAKLTGVSVASMCNWEYNRWPAPKWAILLCQILAAKRQALITGQRPTLSIDEN